MSGRRFKGGPARRIAEGFLGHKLPKTEELEQQVREFNLHNVIGQAVNVRKDDGSIFETRTRSEAWMLGGHTPMVQVEGISGCYLLERITPRLTTAPALSPAGDIGHGQEVRS